MSFSTKQMSLFISLFLIFSVLLGCREGSKSSSTSAPTTTNQGDVISFSPAVTYVNNPVGKKLSASGSQQFTITMTMNNSLGQPLLPSVLNPIHVNVYGAPPGVISPTATTTSTGSVTFTYNGESFPNNISINAWITDTTNNGAALGVTQVLQQNPLPCSTTSTSYSVHLAGTLPDAIQVLADVGYSTSSPTTTLNTYTVDTGSLGVIVPTSELPLNNGNVIGPGAMGVKYYDSSGNTFSGNYYLAPVRLKLKDGTTVMTQPIMVLGINNAYCTGPKTGPNAKSCYTQPPTPTLHYLGVGFNRNSTIANDLFNSPTANAFLHMTDSTNGTDVAPGYFLTPGDNSMPTGLTLGVGSTTGYKVIDLSSNPSVPGDFNAQYGCFSFPNLPAPNQFCGTALLDIGIDYMFLDLPKAKWPFGDNVNEVPIGTAMTILMGNSTPPAMEYGFNAVQSNPPADTATPTSVQWIDSTSTGLIFVNTGRRPLYIYDYFYQGQCGQVGFASIP